MLFGPLIHPMWVAIAQLDTAATAAAASPNGGYDPIFREPRVASTNGGGAASKVQPLTKYGPAIYLHAQIERGARFRQRMTKAGDAPTSDLRVVLWAKELRDKGLINDDGSCVLKNNDKLLGIWETCGQAEAALGAQVEETQDPPGLRCIEVRPGGGLFGQQSLFVMHFQSDETTVVR